MRYRELFEAAVPAISPQEASDKDMFGPMYHGTTGSLADIVASGFKAERSIPVEYVGSMNRPVGTSHGYSMEGYGYSGIAPPVHHLGFGSYFTTVKAIAKQFAGGTMKGQRMFYLDSQNVLEINFGSVNTMMRWWFQNGYDMTAEATKNRDVKQWIEATKKLTDKLSKEHDAVWFKGKGIRRLLDGDQICVYRTDLIRVVDRKLATGLQIGAKVLDDLKPDDWGAAGKLAGTGWRGVFRGDETDEEKKNREARGLGRYPIHFIPPSGVVGTIVDSYQTNHPRDQTLYHVKWDKGGRMLNYRAEELQPYQKKST